MIWRKETVLYRVHDRGMPQGPLQDQYIADVRHEMTGERVAQHVTHLAIRQLYPHPLYPHPKRFQTIGEQRPVAPWDLGGLLNSPLPRY